MVTSLTQEPNKYAANPEETQKNKEILERAMYWVPNCYARLKEPADKVGRLPNEGDRGLHGVRERVSQVRTRALHLEQLGTLYLMQKKPEEADKCFARLAHDFPDSELTKNIAYAQIRALMELGRVDMAVQAFDDMMANAKKFVPLQFFQVGRYMEEAKQHEAATKAFEQARATTSETNLWEVASMGKAQALAAMSKYTEAVIPLTQITNRNPSSAYTVDACLLLSRSYSEIGKAEKDPAQQSSAFNSAVAALNRVRRVSRIRKSWPSPNSIWPGSSC